MNISQLAKDLFENKGGIEKHNLNHIIQLLSQKDDNEETLATSNYYDIDDMLDKFKSKKSDFSVLTLNIDGINTKFNELTLFLRTLADANFYFSAILLQETMLSDDDCNSENIKIFEIPNYELLKQGRKCGRKGGLFIYIHENYNGKHKKLYKPSADWEGFFIEVTSPILPNKIILGNVYRPPRDNYSDASIDRFLEPFSDILTSLQSENCALMICGDFNINLLRLNEREKFQQFFDIFATNNILPVITLPTRFSKKNATLIDQIFCRYSKFESYNTSGILMKKISDHLPCFTTINIQNKPLHHPKFVNIKDTSQKAMDNFRSEIVENIANGRFCIDSSTDPNYNYAMLEKIITSARDKCFPVKKVKFNKYKHKIAPWITQGILTSMKFRDKLYVKWKKTNHLSMEYQLLENSFKSFTAILQKNIRMAKSQYYHDKFQNYKSDMKKTWTQINEIIKKKKTVQDLPKYFIDNEKKITENKEIANCFNNFFANIGPSLAKSIKKPSNKSFKDYLNQEVTSKFTFKQVRPEELLKVIINLKPKSSTGHDGISTVLLKYIAHDILHILTVIINQSLNTGIFPDSLKIAKITPIFKKENPHITDNYRPISLLPSISKIFEKVVYTQIYDYFTENNLLYDSQYGFRKFHSTEFAALEMTDKISTQLDEGKLPMAIFLDLSKAFDTIDHKILIDKLSYYGISGNSLNWFQSYLSNRKQFVDYNGELSSYANVTTGVPQGSILGPLLFIIYMNDVVKITNKFHSILYADDTSLIEPIGTFNINIEFDCDAVSDAINKELNEITDWLALNKLSLNSKKTKMMIFHHRQKNISNLIPKLYINGSRIERVNEFNFLGTMLDEHLSWKSHTQKIASKIAIAIGNINRLKKFLPRDILKTIYNALIQPHLNFSILLWGQNIKRITKLQKWAVRAITCSKYNAHTDPIFKKLNILKVKDIYKLTALKFHYKFKNDLLPKSFQGIFTSVLPSHTYDTRQRNNPRLVIPKTVLAKSTIRYAIPELVNQLPVCITEKIYTHSIQGIAMYAKKYMINLYSETCVLQHCYICNS